jgi:hypothetical protein
MNAPRGGNLWSRAKERTADRQRWRELAYLLLRFPVGIFTFTVAVTALAVPVLLAWAPFANQEGGRHPFGDWAYSSRIEDIAASSWGWLLVPFGLALLVAGFHLVNALANACGRWTDKWLRVSPSGATPGRAQT